MWALRGVAGYLFGVKGGEAKQDTYSVLGRLYEFGGSGRDVVRKCRFLSCKATAVSTARAHSYELVVEENNDDNNEAAGQLVFDLLPGADFTRCKPGDTLGSKDSFESTAFSFRDLEGKLFALELDDDCADPNVFHDIVCRCIWERVNQRSSEHEPAESWRKYLKSADAASSSSSPARPSAAASAAGAGPSSPARPVALTGDEIARFSGDLFALNAGTFVFDLAEKDIQVVFCKVKPFVYDMIVCGQRNQIVTRVGNAMAVQYPQEHISAIWTHMEGPVMSYHSVVFPSAEALDAFQRTISALLYETARKEALAPEDNTFVFDAMRESLARPAGEVREDKREFDATLSEHKRMKRESWDWAKDEEEEPEEEEEEESEEETPPRRSAIRASAAGRRSSVRNGDFFDTSKSSKLAVGYTHNRTVMTRGNQIGIFKEEDDDLSHVATIKNLRTPLKGASFTPSKIMMYNKDQELLLLSEESNDSVFRLDLNRGEVVEEWKAGNDMAVDHVTGESKFSQMEAGGNLVGLNSTTLFKMDPRLWGTKKAVVVDESVKQYKTNYRFNLASTSASGNCVVTSATGEMRLYNEIGKIAKTQLPGLGDPITGVDVTADGKYLLCTTDTYLLIVPTEGPDGTSGFKKSLGQNKPKPKKLQISAVDRAKYGIKKLQFSAAHFNTGRDASEVSIVTATGAFVITWDFRAVLNNKLDAYKIVQMDSKVVADSFQYNRDDKVLVALPTDARILTRK
eukprot:tig00021432_g21225.t1